MGEEAVRLRPALELEQSIQGQVAEAFVRDSLINAIRPFTEPPPSDTTTKRPIVRPPSPRPRTLPTIARSRQATKTSQPIREPVSVSRDPRPITDFAPDSRPINRRVVFPSLAATRVDTNSETKQKDEKFKLPESIKANVVAEVDNMIKKHADKMKTKLPASRIEEIDREVHVARQNAEIENEKLKAEIDELRTKLLKTENSLRSRIRSSQSESVSEKTRLNNLLSLIQKETAQLDSGNSVAQKSDSRVSNQVSRFAPRGKAETFVSGSFFNPRIDNTPTRPSKKDSMVEVEGVEFPKFSRMVKNTGLRIFAEDERAIPVEAIVPQPSRSRTSVARPRTRPSPRRNQAPQVVKKSKPEPAVQGFKVKGDTSNRIIFLNIADLGLTSSSDKPIKLGNSELVPVDGLTDFSSSANSQPGKPMNIDAVDKMVTTHLQHNTQPRRPVNLPEFSQPLDNFRGARTHSNNNNFAPNSRQITSRRPTTAVRKQPVQFFNKFDDGGLDNSQQLQQQDVQQPPTFTSSQTPRQGKASTLDNNFGSFPSRSSQSSLPSRQTVSRPPVQQLQQQQPSDQLPSFTRLTSNQQSQTQQLNNFQPQQQNCFQPQQQQTRFQPQQQQTPQFQPQQQTQSVEDAYK